MQTPSRFRAALPKNTFAIAAAVIALLGAACGDGPIAPPVPSSVMAPGNVKVRVEVSGADLDQDGYEMIYSEASQLYSSWLSRYVLFTDGRFELQLAGGGGGVQFTGRYTTVVSGADTTIAFDFDANDWAATAELRGNLLIVSYNEEAQWDDFIGGTYVRVTTPQPTQVPEPR